MNYYSYMENTTYCDGNSDQDPGQITQWCKNPDPDPEPNWNQCRSTTMLVSEYIFEFGKQNWMTNTSLSSIIFKIKFCGIMG
jgi:hypothetical protein